MSSINIIAVPPGFAPEEIRREWVGIQLPLATPEELTKYSLDGFRIGNQNRFGFIVIRERAVQALRAAGKTEAANYWEHAPMVSSASYIEFKKDVCELVQ